MAYFVDNSSFRLSAIAVQISENKKGLALPVLKSVLAQLPALQATALIIRLCEDVVRFGIEVSDDDPIIVYGVDEFGSVTWTQSPSIRLNTESVPCLHLGSHYLPLNDILDVDPETIMVEVITVQYDDENIPRPVVSYQFPQEKSGDRVASGMKRPPVVLQLPLAVKGDSPEEIHENWRVISAVWSNSPEDYFPPGVLELMKRESFPSISHKCLTPGRYKIVGEPYQVEIDYIGDDGKKSFKKTIVPITDGYSIEFDQKSKVCPLSNAQLAWAHPDTRQCGYMWLVISSAETKIDQKQNKKVFLSGNISTEKGLLPAAREKLQMVDATALERMLQSSLEMRAAKALASAQSEITTITVIPH